MHTTLLLTHSVLRYFVLLALVAVIARCLVGLLNKKPYAALDNKLGLLLLIFTHLQFLLGLGLYFFTSSFVNFSGMEDQYIRYWTVEHISMMIIAVALITTARGSSKKLKTDRGKHLRMLILNSIALLIILAAISMSGRGFFGVTGA